MYLKLKAVEITTYDFNRGEKQYHMPILKLAGVTNDDAAAEVFVGYLSPFRGYRFQVSATHDGQVDLGSSDVVGLANLKITSWGNGTATAVTASNCNLVGITKNLLQGLMLDAITDFLGYPHSANRWAIQNGIVIDEDEKMVIDAGTIRDVKRSEIFKQYITQVYNYLYDENVAQEEW